jgi:hypothetical protein
VEDHLALDEVVEKPGRNPRCDLDQLEELVWCADETVCDEAVNLTVS